MIKPALIFALMITATGCATFTQLESGLSSLVGQPEAEVFQALGYPNGKQSFGEDTVYIWGRNTSTTMFMPQTQTTSGYVGSTSFYGQTTSMQATQFNFNCTIRVIVTAGHVKSWDYDGNLGGCESYIIRMNKHLKQSRPHPSPTSSTTVTPKNANAAASSGVRLGGLTSIVRPLVIYMSPNIESEVISYVWNDISLEKVSEDDAFFEVITSNGNRGFVLKSQFQ